MTDYKEVCLIIVTFFPQENTLLNVGAFANIWPNLKIVIVDNTNNPSDPYVQTFFDDLARTHPLVHTIRNHANAGIATALNQGAKYAIEQGFRWMVTLDQDTELDSEYFSAIDKILQNKDHDRPIAVIGVNYINLVTGKPGELILKDKPFYSVRDVITSGSIVSLHAYQSIGGFLDKLFIDMVDTEYCFRAREHGFEIIFLNKPLMYHSLGHKKTIHLFGFNIAFSAHAPFRHYFIFRNTVYMVTQYIGFDFAWSLKMIFWYLPKVFTKAMLDNTRWESLGRVVCGVRDGLIPDFTTNEEGVKND